MRTVSSKNILVIFIVITVVITGMVLLNQSHAATAFVSTEPDNGAITTPAVLVSDATASTGKAIAFRSTVTPSPSPTPLGSCSAVANTPGGSDVSGGCWPGPASTGYPHGLTGDTRASVSLSPYTGVCGLRTDNQVIDGKDIKCDGILVYAHNVIIKNSRINSQINTNASTASLTLIDTEVVAGADHSQAVGTNNVTMLRVNISGDQHSFHCGDNCTATDSYLHDQYPGGRDLGWHQNAFITNGGTNHTLIHNTMGCTGGCTAVVGLIPDGNISHVTVDHNLIIASPDSSYCLYGGGNSGNKPGIASYIVYKNNVLQHGSNGKCGNYGPVTYFNPASTGNQWLNNKWEDGTPVQSAN